MNAFILSLAITWAITYWVIKLMWRLKIVDDPKKNKHVKVTHSVATPRGGGLAVYMGILITALIFLPVDQHLIGILLGGGILVGMGLLDDIYNLNPYKRLFVQFLAASFPIAAGIGIAYVSNPLGEGIIDLSYLKYNFYFLGETRSIWILSDLLALLWIVILMNFLNMGAKGLPGQLSGIMVIAALAIAALSHKFSADITEWPVYILAMITAGAFLGFLPWHTWPQKIMPSFSGSNLGGYMLGVLSILTTTKIGTLAVVLGIPLIDTGYIVVKRVLSGKSPVWGDRDHLHHKLLDNYGLSRLQITYIYWILTALLAILAYYLNAKSKLYTIVAVALLLGGFILWTTHRSKR